MSDLYLPINSATALRDHVICTYQLILQQHWRAMCDFYLPTNSDTALKGHVWLVLTN